MSDVQQATFGTAPDPAVDKAQADHNAAMAAKYDAAQTGAPAPAEPTSGATPPTEKILGKFNTQADLEAAYKALEAKLGAPKEPPAADPAKPTDPLKVEPPAPADATKAVEEAGLDMDALSAEWTAKGTLPDEAFAKLAKAGISKDMVSAYAAGQQALANQTRAEVFAAVGIKGDEDFAQVSAWASANMKADEVEAYNKAVGPGSTKAQTQLAVEALYARYVRSQGSEPKLLQAQAGKQTGGESYASQAEWLAEVKDPRYQKDPAFRAKVSAKLSRSQL